MSKICIPIPVNENIPSGKTERTGARVERAYTLPRDADAEHVSASHVDGILTLIIPRKCASVHKTHIAVNAPKPEAEEKAPEAKAAEEDMEDEQ